MDILHIGQVLEAKLGHLAVPFGGQGLGATGHVDAAGVLGVAELECSGGASLQRLLTQVHVARELVQLPAIVHQVVDPARAAEVVNEGPRRAARQLPVVGGQVGEPVVFAFFLGQLGGMHGLREVAIGQHVVKHIAAWWKYLKDIRWVQLGSPTPG